LDRLKLYNKILRENCSEERNKKNCNEEEALKHKSMICAYKNAQQELYSLFPELNH